MAPGAPVPPSPICIFSHLVSTLLLLPDGWIFPRPSYPPHSICGPRVVRACVIWLCHLNRPARKIGAAGGIARLRFAVPLRSDSWAVLPVLTDGRISLMTTLLAIVVAVRQPVRDPAEEPIIRRHRKITARSNFCRLSLSWWRSAGQHGAEAAAIGQVFSRSLL